jgi:hypothetical protein
MFLVVLRNKTPSDKWNCGFWQPWFEFKVETVGKLEGYAAILKYMSWGIRVRNGGSDQWSLLFG